MTETSTTMKDLLTELEQIRADLKIQKRVLRDMELLSEELIEFVNDFKQTAQDRGDKHEKEAQIEKQEEEERISKDGC